MKNYSISNIIIENLASENTATIINSERDKKKDWRELESVQSLGNNYHNTSNNSLITKDSKEDYFERSNDKFNTFKESIKSNIKCIKKSYLKEKDKTTISDDSLVSPHFKQNDSLNDTKKPKTEKQKLMEYYESKEV